jgi:metal-responsive CopG/Arc/MetJ family transcriptional regulator
MVKDPVTVTIDRALLKRLDEYVRRKPLGSPSRSIVVERAICFYLDELERRSDIAVEAEALKRRR